jgi:hypothetical protein
MAAIIAPMEWNAAASPLAELSTTSEVSGLGLRSVLTTQVADVWRLAPEAEILLALPTDTAAGAVAGGNVERIGAVPPPSGVTGATAYRNPETGGAFVRAGSPAVLAGYLYTASVWMRRRPNQPSVVGRAISLVYPTGPGASSRVDYLMSALAQGSDWQRISVQFRPTVDGNISFSLAVVTGAFEYEAAGATLVRVAGQTRLDANLGQDVACRLLLLAAPRDGILPVADSTWRAIGYSAAGAVVHDSGDLPLAPAPRGRWTCVLPADVVARRWRIVFGFGPGQPYAQFGRLYIGPALVTSKAIGFGLQRGAGDLGSNQRSAGSGVRYPARAVTLQQRNWRLPSMNAADAVALDDIALLVGATGQVFAAPSILAPERDGILGVFRAPPAPREDNKVFWSADISIEEDC